MNYEGDNHVRSHGTGVSIYETDSQTQQYMFEYDDTEKWRTD